MSNMTGKKIKIQIFGQSHSEALGVVIDGLPAGLRIDTEKIEKLLLRRKGEAAISTKRRENDMPEIVSGLIDGVTCMAPLCAIFENNDTRSRDYSALKVTPRPSHADYTAILKSNGFNDYRGGGAFSGRLTLPLCFAGAICMQILESMGVYVGAHVSSIGHISDTPFDPVKVCPEDFPTEIFPVRDEKKADEMRSLILSVASERDSIGGTVECAVCGLRAGIGQPMFDGLENVIASAVFGIPAVKGIEFGSGFGCATMRGSEHNDPLRFDGDRVVTSSNNSGGINGGISNGMPILFRVAIKPTPSISLPQETVNLVTGENATLEIVGRHDPCIVPRAVACVEAATAIALLNAILDE